MLDTKRYMQSTTEYIIYIIKYKMCVLELRDVNFDRKIDAFNIFFFYFQGFNLKTGCNLILKL